MSAFTYVQTKKKQRKRKGKASEPPSFDVILSRVAHDLNSTGWIDSSLDLLRDHHPDSSSRRPEHVLCLGLGSPTCSAVSTAQLHFLIQLSEHFHIPPENITLFDPAFLLQDKHALNDLNFNVLKENKHGFYDMSLSTALYMPHCGLSLHENIFRQNWTRQVLDTLIIISNDLKGYAESISARKFEADAPCTARLVPHLVVHALPMCTSMPTAFNNIAFQRVRTGSLPPLGDAFWTLPPGSQSLALSNDPELR